MDVNRQHGSSAAGQLGLHQMDVIGQHGFEADSQW
jgi:hypothetical protein